MALLDLTYVLITPARDEATNLRRLGACVVSQSVIPSRWIVVDDGSSDDTAEVLRDLAQDHPWISRMDSPGVVTHAGPLGAGRTSGRDMVAFNAGLAALDEAPSVVVKLDADVSFEPDYFERILEAIQSDASLGITSGICLELEGDEWRAQHVTRSHVRGATRAYRWECLQGISPLVERLGWDTVDEVQATLQGWRIRTLDDLSFHHHRRVGERDGNHAAWRSQGALAWYLGYRPSYLIARTVFRMRSDRAAASILAGWLEAARRREPRHPDAEVRRFLRRQQSLTRLPARAREALGRDT